MRRTLAVAEAELGPRHPRIGRLQLMLSRALDFSGDPAGAEQAAQRAVDISRTTLGDRHSQTARALQALANVLFRKGDYKGSVHWLSQANEVMAAVYGPKSHQVGGMSSSIGLSLSRAGQYEEADRVHRQAVAILARALGADHPETAAAVGRQGANLAAVGRHETAIDLCRQAMVHLERSDPQHARILDQVRCIGSSLIELGRATEAVPVLERGLALSAVRDEPPPYTAMLELMAAKALWAKGERERAVELARAADGKLTGDETSEEKGRGAGMVAHARSSVSRAHARALDYFR